ncbi:MAG: lytic transglycosylase domain-containing protein [Thiolinea sp.]
MTIWNRWWLLALISWLSWAGVAQAATGDSAAAKTAGITLDASKVSHPCARKPVPELNQKSTPFQQSIHTYARKFSVDSDLIRSVITIESCYLEKALSPKSAQGLMQLIPATAERFGVSNAYDSEQNIRGGTQYLGWLSQRFGGDLVKVLAAYNAGEGKVDRYDGIPPYRETRNYVHDVLVVYKKFKQHREMIAEAKNRQQQAEQEQQRARQQQQAALDQQQAQQRARQQQLAQQQRRVQQPTAQAAGPAVPDRADTHQIIIGQVSRPIPPPAAQPVRRQPPPVLRQASAKTIRNPAQPAQNQNNANNVQSQRVKKVYASPFKPGRAGWQANKQLAPHLYKQ